VTRFPRQVLKSVAVYHLPSSGSKVYPGSADVTIEGAFLPMDERQHALEGGIYTNAHELYFDVGDDLRVSDKVVIDSTTYFVKKVFSASFGGLRHKRASLSTES